MNTMKVKVAIARKMLNAVWHVSDEGVAYRDYKEHVLVHVTGPDFTIGIF